jgi:hypothetical protein
LRIRPHGIYLFFPPVLPPACHFPTPSQKMVLIKLSEHQYVRTPEFEEYVRKTVDELIKLKKETKSRELLFSSAVPILPIKNYVPGGIPAEDSGGFASPKPSSLTNSSSGWTTSSPGLRRSVPAVPSRCELALSSKRERHQRTRSPSPSPSSAPKSPSNSANSERGRTPAEDDKQQGNRKRRKSYRIPRRPELENSDKSPRYSRSPREPGGEDSLSHSKKNRAESSPQVSPRKKEEDGLSSTRGHRRSRSRPPEETSDKKKENPRSAVFPSEHNPKLTPTTVKIDIPRETPKKKETPVAVPVMSYLVRKISPLPTSHFLPPLSTFHVHLPSSTFHLPPSTFHLPPSVSSLQPFSFLF